LGVDFIPPEGPYQIDRGLMISSISGLLWTRGIPEGKVTTSINVGTPDHSRLNWVPELNPKPGNIRMLQLLGAFLGENWPQNLWQFVEFRRLSNSQLDDRRTSLSAETLEDPPVDAEIVLSAVDTPVDNELECWAPDCTIRDPS
jgi:hypothetical protein